MRVRSIAVSALVLASSLAATTTPAGARTTPTRTRPARASQPAAGVTPSARPEPLPAKPVPAWARTSDRATAPNTRPRGVPVNPRPTTVEQPDGTRFTAVPWGDAGASGLEGTDGHTLARRADGTWVYTTGLDAVCAGWLVPGGRSATRPAAAGTAAHLRPATLPHPDPSGATVITDGTAHAGEAAPAGRRPARRPCPTRGSSTRW